MEYTKKELMKINDAMIDSGYYLRTAYWNLERFIASYLEEEAPKELIFSLQTYPEAIRSILDSVLILLKLSLTELDKYSMCEMWTVRQALCQYNDIMEIKKAYRETEKES